MSKKLLMGSPQNHRNRLRKKIGLAALIFATILLASCPPPTPDPTPNPTDTLLDAPTNLVLSADDGEIRLTWDEVADAANYRIYRDAERIATDTTIAETNYTDSGLANDIEYSYTVRAVDAAGNESGDSNEESATPGTPPAAPARLRSTASGGQVNLSWDEVAGAVRYRVHRDGTRLATDTTITETNYIDRTAVRGVVYNYTVQAVDRFSRVGPATTGPTVRLDRVSTPGNFRATGNSAARKVDFTWDEVAVAVSYRLYRRTNTGEFTDESIIARNIAGTSYTDTTPELDTTYYYAVQAVGVNGGLSHRTSSEHQPEVLLLSPPQTFNAVAITGSVTLTWSPVFLNGKYRIYRNGEPIFTTERFAVLTYTDKTVTTGTAYTYFVRALSRRSNIESADSMSRTVTPMEANFSSLALAGNASPTGIWSDGTTMWVADSTDDKLYAYTLETELRDIDKDIDLATNMTPAFGNGIPADLWGNDDRLWVLDDGGLFTSLFAYNRSTKEAAAENFTKSSLDGAMANVPRGIWSDNTTMWIVALVPVQKAFAFNLSTRMRDDMDEDMDMVPDKEFNLHADNNDPRGLWSYGGTVWVADDNDDKLYAYNLASGARVPDQDFETLSAAGNNKPTSMWSDADTMWVLDRDNARIYSYNMTDKAHID